MSNQLSDLDPQVEQMAEAMLTACAAAGISLFVTQTLRTYEEQAAIYSQGRTAPGAIVTHAPPGYSWHNFGRAFDVAQAGLHPYPTQEAFWEKVGEIGEANGLEWGGRWKFPDRPHFQFTGGLSLATARLNHDTQDQTA